MGVYRSACRVGPARGDEHRADTGRASSPTTIIPAGGGDIDHGIYFQYLTISDWDRQEWGGEEEDKTYTAYKFQLLRELNQSFQI